MAQNDNNQGAAATGETDIRKAVETANAEDENLKNRDDSADDDDASDDDDDNSEDDAGANAADKANSTDSDDTDGDEDEDEDDADDKADAKPDEKKDSSTRRFTQFAGDGSDEAYLSNLEKGYDNSSKEAIRINSELGQANNRIDSIMRAIQSDPDLATKLNAAIKDGADAGGSGDDQNSAAAGDNPFVRNLQTEWQQKSETEIEAFIEANPEVSTDPQIGKDVKHWMNVFSTDAYNRTGKLMSGGEAMALAYKHLSLENKLEKQNLADGAKKTAAHTRSRGKAKKSSGEKPSFTSEQIAMAQVMGRDEDWLAKNAK